MFVHSKSYCVYVFFPVLDIGDIGCLAHLWQIQAYGSQDGISHTAHAVGGLVGALAAYGSLTPICTDTRDTDTRVAWLVMGEYCGCYRGSIFQSISLRQAWPDFMDQGAQGHATMSEEAWEPAAFSKAASNRSLQLLQLTCVVVNFVFYKSSAVPCLLNLKISSHWHSTVFWVSG